MTETDPLPEDLLPEPPAAGPGLFGDAPVAPAPATVAPAAPYRVLARAYRPSRFEDLIGQDAMVRILRRAFATGRIAHAFMLTGVRGTGKTTTARIIARCLNCTGPDGQGGPTADPCGVCANCRAIMADRHPDVIEMDAASRTGVDDVREIIEATRFRPMEARVKVFIIDEVHMLSRNAFNALLKTLEEPPPHVKFVFATTELRKVPITVLSRCQKFDLRRISTTELAAHFGRIATAEGVAVSPEALEVIARAADGSVRDGLSLLDQAIVMGAVQDGLGAPQPITAEAVADMLGLADQGLVFDLFERIMTGDAAAVLAALDQAHERGADAGLVLQDLLSLTHSLSRLKAAPALRDSPDLPQLYRGQGADLADRLSIPVLGRAWQMLLKGVQEVEQAPDRRAAAEMVLIRLCYLSDQPSPGDIVKRLTAGGDAPRPAAPSLAAPVGDGGGPTGGARAIMGGGGGGAMAMLRAVPDAQPVEIPAAAAPQMVAAAEPDPAPTPFVAMPASFREVISLVRELKELTLYGHLLHSVHLVRFAAPVIEIRPRPEAPRDVSSKLAGLLQEATGQRWTIAISTAAGEPTIDEQRTAADNQREQEASEHPLVRAIMDAFPGARIENVRDPMVDEYRLPPTATTDDKDGDAVMAPGAGALLPDDLPDFAPPDAELLDDTDMEIE